jgi:hypothetical protein
VRGTRLSLPPSPLPSPSTTRTHHLGTTDASTQYCTLPPGLVSQLPVACAAGGISWLGTAASAAGGFFVGLSFFVASLLSLPASASVASTAVGKLCWVLPLGLAAGLVGSTIDSLLGATIQFRCASVICLMRIPRFAIRVGDELTPALSPVAPKATRTPRKFDRPAYPNPVLAERWLVTQKASLEPLLRESRGLVLTQRVRQHPRQDDGHAGAGREAHQRAAAAQQPRRQLCQRTAHGRARCSAGLAGGLSGQGRRGPSEVVRSDLPCSEPHAPVTPLVGVALRAFSS